MELVIRNVKVVFGCKEGDGNLWCSNVIYKILRNIDEG